MSKISNISSATSPISPVGLPIAHDSAGLHVQGRAIYIDDMPEPDGLLHVAPGYAINATCGKIISLDLTEVKKLDGVVRVLTARDIPGKNNCSPSIDVDPILADGEIFFHGQVIFLVIAKTREIARRATRLAKIEIAQTPPTVTVDDAIAYKTKDVIPPNFFLRGQPAESIAGSANQLNSSFLIGGQEHFYLEGQVALCIADEYGEITVHSSTQYPTEVQHIVANMLGLPYSKVNCICRRMGGAFGGKESQASQWAALAALACYVTGRAAKCRLDRDDDMIMTGKRHDFKVEYAAGYDNDGMINGVDVNFLSRCGYSADLSFGINERTMFHADNAYFYPDVQIKSRRLMTNTVSNTAFRGFGGPQGMVFAEQMLSAIAIKLGIDPLDIRKRNLYRPGSDKTPYGMTVNEHIVLDIMEQLEISANYRQRRETINEFNKNSPFIKKGLALTPVKFGISFTI